jgi:hypothetical protein
MAAIFAGSFPIDDEIKSRVPRRRNQSDAAFHGKLNSGHDGIDFLVA